MESENQLLHEDPLFDPASAAHYLDSSTSTLAKQRMRGDGPNYIKMGRSVKYRKSDLDRYIGSKIFHNTSQY